jgi:hypothetical protein
MNSALPKISQPVASEARRNRISGVLPIAPAIPSAVGAFVICILLGHLPGQSWR